MFIDGIGISGYRSFGPEVRRIGPFKKINLIIGQNNSGKSNVLRFIKEHYPTMAKGAIPKLEPLDLHISNSASERCYEIAIAKDGGLYEHLMERLSQNSRDFNSIVDEIRSILSSYTLTKNSDIIWFPFIPKENRLVIKESIFQEILDEDVLPRNIWQMVWNNLTGTMGGGILGNWIPEVLGKMSPKNLSKIDVSLIPGIREVIGGDGDQDDLMSGRGLIKQLARLQNARFDRLQDKKQFEKVNHFLQTVTGNKTARIEIPSEQDIIQVSMNGRTLPLSHLGTGIHEVIILATIATIKQEQIICIEEPEIHLHPLLQKQLLKYLAEHTNNQYFIATHSAHILDVSDVAIFHVRLENDMSVVEPVLTDSHRSVVCDELGYRASDLLQANCVVWVEGPSDRIYLNHWIQSVDDSLVEGIHYSIMFYGGRLLSHLSGEDLDEDEVEDFISLRRLNRHAVIMIDSDKKNSEADINQTKQRIQEEFEKGAGHAWITPGREIENYIDADLIEAVVKTVHKNAKKITKKGQYENLLRYSVDGGGKPKDANKVKVAREVVKTSANLEILDLQGQVTKLIAFIKDSNGLE